MPQLFAIGGCGDHAGVWDSQFADAQYGGLRSFCVSDHGAALYILGKKAMTLTQGVWTGHPGAFARIVKVKPDVRHPHLLRWREAMQQRPAMGL